MAKSKLEQVAERWVRRHYKDVNFILHQDIEKSGVAIGKLVLRAAERMSFLVAMSDGTKQRVVDLDDLRKWVEGEDGKE